MSGPVVTKERERAPESTDSGSTLPARALSLILGVLPSAAGPAQAAEPFRPWLSEEKPTLFLNSAATSRPASALAPSEQSAIERLIDPDRKVADRALMAAALTEVQGRAERFAKIRERVYDADVRASVAAILLSRNYRSDGSSKLSLAQDYVSPNVSLPESRPAPVQSAEYFERAAAFQDSIARLTAEYQVLLREGIPVDLEKAVSPIRDPLRRAGLLEQVTTEGKKPDAQWALNCLAMFGLDATRYPSGIAQISRTSPTKERAILDREEQRRPPGVPSKIETTADLEKLITPLATKLLPGYEKFAPNWTVLSPHEMDRLAGRSTLGATLAAEWRIDTRPLDAVQMVFTAGHELGHLAAPVQQVLGAAHAPELAALRTVMQDADGQLSYARFALDYQLKQAPDEQLDRAAMKEFCDRWKDVAAQERRALSAAEAAEYLTSERRQTGLARLNETAGDLMGFVFLAEYDRGDPELFQHHYERMRQCNTGNALSHYGSFELAAALVREASMDPAKALREFTAPRTIAEEERLIERIERFNRERDVAAGPELLKDSAELRVASLLKRVGEKRAMDVEALELRSRSDLEREVAPKFVEHGKAAARDLEAMLKSAGYLDRPR